jgi:hypothetical protein
MHGGMPGHAMQGHGAGEGGHGGHRGHGGRHDGQARGEQRLMSHDADGDGKVSRTEFESAHQAAAQRRMQAFDAADANRDGALTVDEQRAFRDSMRAQMGAQMGARQGAGRDGGHRHGGPGPRGTTPAAPAAPAAPTANPGA